MPTYQQLNHVNEATDLDDIYDLRALYRGGKDFRKRAHRFLPRRAGEADDIYAMRTANPSFRPYMGSIVDFFAGAMFLKEPVAVPTRSGEAVNLNNDYYDRFKSNCDGAETDFASFIKSVFTSAVVEGRSWVAINWPDDNSGYLEPPQNLADFHERGLGEYRLEKLENEQVLDWETDAAGNLVSVVVHRKSLDRLGSVGARNIVTENWDIYTSELVERFSVTYPANRPPHADDEIFSVGIRPHNLGVVPVMCLEFGPAQHLGARLQSPQIAHTVALNQESWSLACAAFAMPVLNVEEKNFQPKFGAGYYFLLGMEEKASWLAAPTDHLEALATAIENHKDEIYRVAASLALGVNNNAASVGRSAESKAVDAAQSRVAIESFADEVRDFIGRIYKTISGARGELVDAWEIQGLTDFDLIAYLNALKLLTEATGGVHSPAARAALETRAVDALLPDAKPAARTLMRHETMRNTLAPADTYATN